MATNIFLALSITCWALESHGKIGKRRDSLFRKSQTAHRLQAVGCGAKLVRFGTPPFKAEKGIDGMCRKSLYFNELA